MKIIIDADHILYMCLNGLKRLDENGIPLKENEKFVYDPKPFETACEDADKYIRSILLKTSATYYVGFIGGNSKNRKLVNSSYKANRIDKPKPDNFDELKNYLINKWKFIHVIDAEVDDYVYSCYKNNPDSMMVSPDKDILFLEGKHYSPRRDEFVITSSSTAYYYFWASMLTGDSADNIKGIPNVGPKTAEKILEGKENYHTIVFDAYCSHFGMTLGIEEFYKNYQCLLIRDDIKFEVTFNNFNEFEI
jgi:5'-3' exonuclease